MDILEKTETKVMQCMLMVLSWRYLTPKTRLPTFWLLQMVAFQSPENRSYFQIYVTPCIALQYHIVFQIFVTFCLTYGRTTTALLPWPFSSVLFFWRACSLVVLLPYRALDAMRFPSTLASKYRSLFLGSSLITTCASRVWMRFCSCVISSTSALWTTIFFSSGFLSLV